MMKKHWKLLLLCVAIATIMCALCFSLNAVNYSGKCGGEGDGSNITWSFNTDTGLLKFEGTGKMANYGPDGAFPSPWYDKYESQIRSVEIGEGITSIGSCAFYKCIYLSSAVIPEGVTTLGDSAFSACRSLKEIYIPSTVEKIGTRTFSWFVGLEKITVSENNPVFHSDGNCIIETATKTLLTGCNTSVIPTDGSVTAIGDNAFSGCNGLSSIVIPDCITSIGECPFVFCNSNLTVIFPTGSASYIHDVKYNRNNNCFIDTTTKKLIAICENSVIPTNGSVTSIGERALSYVPELPSINIPSAVTQIDAGAFSGSSFEKVFFLSPDVIIDGGADIPTSTVIYGDAGSTAESYAQAHGNTFAKVLYSGSIYTIEWRIYDNKVMLFSGCGTTGNWEYNSEKPWDKYKESFSDVVVGEGITKLGDRTFYSYKKVLKSITLPNTLEYIGASVFTDCTALTEIKLPNNSLWSLGNSAFGGCTGIKHFHIPGTVRGIHNSFPGCTGIESITVDWMSTYYRCEDGILYTLDKSAIIFVYALNGTTLTIPKTVRSIQSSALDLCTELERFECEEGSVYYTAADGVLYANTDQGKSLVMAPKKLAGKFVVPDDVAVILDSAFSSCTMLTEVQLPSSLWWIGGASFRFCSSLEKINIPENVTSIGQRAFEGCVLLSNIELPQKLEYIQKYAFNGCFGLTSLTITKSVKYIGEYAFNGCTNLKFIYIEPDSVEIASAKIVFPYDAVLICPKSRINDKGEVVGSSTAVEHAIQYGRKYIVCDYLNNSATLGKDFSYNIYALFSDNIKDVVKVRFTMGGFTEEISPALANAGENKYKFVFRGIAPQQLGDFINVELVCDGNVIKSIKNVSLKKYFEKLLECDANTLQYSEKKYSLLKPLIYDIFDYCTAAQKFTGYKTDTLINAGYEGMGTAYSAVTTTDNKTTGTKLENAHFKGKTIYFDSTNKIVFYFITTDVENTVLTIGDKTYTSADFKKGTAANEYKIYSDDVYATEFDKVFTCTISCNGVVGESVSYSIKSYAYSKQDKNDKTGELARCTYKYGVSAFNFANADKTGGFEGELD